MNQTIKALFVTVMDFKEDKKSEIAKTRIVDVRNVVKNYFFFFIGMYFIAD